MGVGALAMLQNTSRTAETSARPLPHFPGAGWEQVPRPALPQALGGLEHTGLRLCSGRQT